MGLDITAYRKLTPAPDAAMQDGCVVEWQKFAQFSDETIDFTEGNWPGRAAGIKPGVYSFAEKDGFRVGSYGGYNSWRDWLARIAGWGSAQACWNSSKTEGPFYELIHFADNEGVIGPKVAAKLAKDFAEFEAQAERMGVDDTYYLEKYREWRNAFEMAADAGAVEFH